MTEERRQLFSIGAFFVAVVIAVVLFITGAIDAALTVPVVFVLFGIWLVALAAMRGGNPQKYERGAFSTTIMGVLLITIGGAWYLFRFGWLYSLVLIFGVFAALAIAAGLRHK